MKVGMLGETRNMWLYHSAVNNHEHRTRLRQRLLISSAFAASLGAHPVLAQTATEQSAAPAELGEVVVTATRRTESISRVPISVTALSQEKMDRQSIRSLEDIARLTPNLTFSAPPGPNGGFDSLAIRGISSSVGSPTSAVYIDETPVQPRALLYTSSNAFPKVFDLERVEVLRGPQGTLFGAGAEGGAVRFITPQPSLTDYSGYARTELASTRYGAPSGEAGLAIGGPIIVDVLGFRASAYVRHDGGWIDRVSPDSGEIVDKNANSENTLGLRAALTFKPADGLTINPSIFYQRVADHDVGQIWENVSNPSNGVFRTEFRDRAPTQDRFILPALRLNYDTRIFQITSNTSYFDRKQRNNYDYTNYVADLTFGDPFRFDPGDETSPQPAGNTQANWTEEVRIQSNQPAFDIIDWVAGGFYSRNVQTAFLNNVTGNATLKAIFGADTLVDGIYGSTIDAKSREREFAGFANLDIHATSKLKLQVGMRVARVDLSYSQSSDGPINGGYSAFSGGDKATNVTPKFGVTYQADPNTMLYVSAAKGYRNGGAQQPVPNTSLTCGADLAGLGLTSSPTTYASDSLWSYELGTKSRLLGGRLSVDGSVYYIKWKNIQQRITLPTCGYFYVDNLGAATSQGFDLAVSAKLTQGLTVSIAAGYTDIKLDKTIAAGPDAILAQKGDAIGGPPWVVTVSGDYDFQISHSIDGYVHFDFTYRDHSPSVNPVVFTYDPDIPGEAKSTFATLRLGARFKSIDGSLFVENLFDESKILDRSHDFVGSPLFYSTTYRPRTIGVTLSKTY